MEPELNFDDAQRLYEQLGIDLPDVDHALRCATFAGALFDGMHLTLGLDPSDRRIAVIAALLHDAGYLRGQRDHHRKSYDIIAAADIPGLNRDDRIITACAARYHGRTMPNIEHAGFGEMDSEQQRRTRRLSAIVRVAAACDASHLGLITSVTASDVGNELVVVATASQEPSVERDRLREAAGGFAALTYVRLRIDIAVDRT